MEKINKKRTAKYFTLFSFVLLLVACMGESDKSYAEKSASSKKPETELEKQSYSFGVSLGQYLKRALDENDKVAINLNREIVLSGVIDAVFEKEKLTPEDIKLIMKELDKSTREQQRLAAKREKEENIKVGKDFLERNAENADVTVTASGLQYSIISSGDGHRPGADDTVKVHYKGTLIDGTEFDSSYARNEPAVFPLKNVIKGWTEGLQLMPVGSKFKFYIPSELAYGERATGKITPNSALIFEVELLEIKENSHQHQHQH